MWVQPVETNALANMLLVTERESCKEQAEVGGLGAHRRLYSILSAQAEEVMSDRSSWQRDWGVGERYGYNITQTDQQEGSK